MDVSTTLKIVSLNSMILRPLPYLILFFSLWDSGSYSQQTEVVDSLKSELDHAKTDSSRMALQLEISHWIGYDNSIEAIHYAEQSLDLALKIGNQDFEFLAYCQLSNLHHILYDYNKGIEFGLKALKLGEEMEDDQKVGQAHNVLGLTYQIMGEYQKAVDHFLIAYETVAKTDDERYLAIISNNVANTYYYLQNWEQSLVYHDIALSIRKKRDDKYGIAASYNDMSCVYIEMEEFDKADSLLPVSLAMMEEIKDVEGRALASGTFGLLKFRQGKYQEAVKSLEYSTSIAKEINAMSIVMENLEVGWQAYEQLGQTNKSFETYKELISIRDSIKSEENAIAFAQKELQYDFERKSLADSLAAVAEQDKIRMEGDRKAERLTYLIIGGTGIAGILVALLVILARSNQQKKRDNQVITEQKQEVELQKRMVESKNQEILDSISYARRIQNAILPPDRLVKEYLNDSFVLYKPKDVVAGDFYWMESFVQTSDSRGEQKGVLFAAADCTGHGVPGAMVSVVCHNAMNRSVREFGLTEPGKILDKVTELVEETFVKSEEEVKDGMDLAFCSLVGNSLQYAGAHNPLWIIRKGEILETKADKMPIGSFENREPYTTHKIELEPGDTFYIFSDGYADQFGGEKGKKFKSKSFKQLLLSIQDQPMEVQRKSIDEAFEKWKGDYEQVDDVCVIGVRV